MKINPWMTSVIATALMVSTVCAQPGGGRGGRGGGGMFGRGGIFMTVNNDAVQKELGLSSDNSTKVKELVDEFNSSTRDAMREAGGGNFQELSAEERNKLFEKMNEATKSNTDKYLPKLKDLLTADQFTRLQQINWQNMGTGAYSDSDVAKSLSITAEQQDKIKSISTEYAAKQRELFANGGARGEEAREKMQEINKERDKKINDILTKDQLDKFASMKGKDFDVEQLRGFGRGRGGRGGDNAGSPGGGGRPKRPQPKAE